jgi:hypothetical protein
MWQKWETISAHRVLVGKSKWKTPLGRPRRRFEDNIKMHLFERGLDSVDWIHQTQDRDWWLIL